MRAHSYTITHLIDRVSDRTSCGLVVAGSMSVTTLPAVASCRDCARGFGPQDETYRANTATAARWAEERSLREALDLENSPCDLDRRA